MEWLTIIPWPCLIKLKLSERTLGVWFIRSLFAGLVDNPSLYNLWFRACRVGCWILSCFVLTGNWPGWHNSRDKTSSLKTVQRCHDFFGFVLYPVLQELLIFLIYHAIMFRWKGSGTTPGIVQKYNPERFNYQFGIEYFRHPEPLYTEVPKLLSLANPEKEDE